MCHDLVSAEALLTEKSSWSYSAALLPEGTVSY